MESNSPTCVHFVRACVWGGAIWERLRVDAADMPKLDRAQQTLFRHPPLPYCFISLLFPVFFIIFFLSSLLLTFSLTLSLPLQLSHEAK